MPYTDSFIFMPVRGYFPDYQVRHSALSSQLYHVEFPPPSKHEIHWDIVTVLRIASDSVPI